MVNIPDYDPLKGLQPGEPHPMCASAIHYVLSHSISDLQLTYGSLVSQALGGNRDAEILAYDLRELITGNEITDKSSLALAWFLKSVNEKHLSNPKLLLN